ncbi:MAG: hypothetical protein GY711_25750 [bacterium]|nr:hypothetical protein [bacterium]
MKILALSAVLVLSANLVPASAQITIDDTLNVTLVFGSPGPAGEQVVASYDASASDKLVVVVSSEHAFGITSGLTIDGVEYNGQAMIEAVEESTLPGTTALYYLDSPGAAGEIRLFTGMKNGGLVTIYALSGTAQGVVATSQSTTASVGITTTSGGSLVIAGLLDGGQASNGNGAGAPTAVGPLTQVHSDIWGANMWGGHASGYQVVATPGTVTPTFATVGPVRLRTVAAVIGEGGTNLGMNYCGPAIPNSTGFPGTISAMGNPAAAANNVTLTASGLPPGQFGYFIAGQTQGFFNPPGSQGLICLNGNIGRYNQIANIIQGPEGSIVLDLTAIPVNPTSPVMPGETWNFQCWYRDLNPTLTNNFTDGLAIQFQ